MVVGVQELKMGRAIKVRTGRRSRANNQRCSTMIKCLGKWASEMARGLGSFEFKEWVRGYETMFGFLGVLG